MKKKVAAAVIVAMLFTMPAYVSAETEQPEDTTETVISEDITETENTEDTAEESEDVETETIEKVDYYNKLIEAEAEKKEYAIFKNQVKAELSEVEIAYLKNLETLSEEKVQIEQAKLELGYSTEILVEEARNNRIAVGLQIQTAEDRLKFYKDSIGLNGGEYEESTLTEQAEEPEKDYVSDFKENSVQLMYYKLQLQEYNEDLQNGRYGTEREVLEKQIELCEIQEKKYEIDLELYVKNLLMQYDSLKRQVEEKENQIAVAEKKLENAVFLQEEGKLSELRLKEMKIELQRLQYEKMSFISDMKLVSYILENALENQEVG